MIRDLRNMMLHEEIVTKNFYITRVVGGWLYKESYGGMFVFVPNAPDNLLPDFLVEENN